MTDKIVNHFVLADGSVARYDYDGLVNAPNIIDKDYQSVKVSELSGATLYTGYYGSTGTDYVELAHNVTAYNSIVYYPETDVDIYIDTETLSSIVYVSICIGENAGGILPSNRIPCTSGTVYRYRKSDGNMPTVSNPLHVKAGSVLVFSETGTANNWKYFFDTFYALSDDIQLSDSQIEQVENSIVDSIDTRKCKLRYVNGAGSDSSTERLEIFIPTVTGYIGYSFLHCYHLETDVSYGHQNIWRVGYASAYDNSLSKRYDLTTSGEWEVALHLKDRTDFSGGNAHGDEIFTDLTVLVDGTPLQYDSFTSLTDFETLTIIERSNLYDPADNTTIIAEHGSEHIFNKDGLAINQSVKWLISDQTTSCYMAMFPISKTVSNKVFVNSDFIVESLPNRVSKSNTTRATLYSDTLGVKAVFEIQKYPLSNPSFLCTDNGGGAYNKCYYVITPDQNVSVNEKWESTTVYQLSVSK